jgi:hypothetical protein
MRFTLPRWIRQALPLVVLAALVAPTAEAQVYKYRDPATGKIILSDNPPSGRAARSPSARGGGVDDDGSAEESGAATAPKATGVDPRLEARKREEEVRERAKAEAENSEIEERKRKICAEIRHNLKTLESGQRIAQMNAAGEREFMTDEARSSEIERMRSELSACE